MMHVVLTFIACLAAAGTECREVEIAWDGTAFQCMLLGQQEVARWAGEHPGFEVKAGHRCTTGKRA